MSTVYDNRTSRLSYLCKLKLIISHKIFTKLFSYLALPNIVNQKSFKIILRLTFEKHEFFSFSL